MTARKCRTVPKSRRTRTANLAHRLPRSILAAGLLALVGTSGCSPGGASQGAAASPPVLGPDPAPAGPRVDRNLDGHEDSEEILSGRTPDVNRNGIPDDAESAQSLPYGTNRMFVFGDSLSDAGNMHRLFGQSQSPPNWNGRYCNGPVWVEYLAKWMGLGNPEVQNFAHGGATTGHGNASVPGGPGLLDEVQSFSDFVAANGPPGADSLFVLWIGPNDFATSSDLAETVNLAMINIEQAIHDLSQLGAQRFLVLNAPDLGKTPRVQDTGDPQYVERARLASIAFNSNLAWTLARLEPQLGVDVIACDLFNDFEELATAPTRFGFQDAQHRCLTSDRDPPCANPDQRVFWDGLHPTTAAHRWIAKWANTALLTGGDPLPRPGVTPPAGIVVLDGPTNGAFVDQSPVTVSGVVLAPQAMPTTLTINGTSVVPSANGRFTVSLPLPGGSLLQPIEATLSDTTSSAVMDRDRLVVFRAPSVGQGEAIATALLADVTRGGLDDVEDLLIHKLVTNGALDIRGHLMAANPIAVGDMGILHYAVDVKNAGYAWSTIELVPQSGQMAVRISLHDVFVDWHVHAWLDGPDPGFDCWGRVTAGMFSIFTDLSVVPSSVPGEVAVQQLTPLRFELPGFAEFHDCDFLVDLASVFRRIEFNVQQRLESGIRSGLGSVNNSNVLPQMLEKAIASVSASRALGGALGVPVGGNITQIAMRPQGLSVGGDLAIGTPGGSLRSLAIPHTLPARTGLEPYTGQPYDFAVSVSLTTLNQLLAAQSGTLLRPLIVDQLDLGSGPVPLTAGRLAALIPALHALDPAFALRLRIRPTLPPMLLGDSGIVPGAISNLAIAQLIAEVLPAASTTSEVPYLSLSLDIDAGLALSFDANDRALVAEVTQGTAHAVLLDNPLGIDEQSLTQLIETLAPRLVASMGRARFPLPELADIDLVPSQIVPESGYASLFFRTATPHGSPDLVVTDIQAPAVVDRHFGFPIQFTVRNLGTGMTRSNGFPVTAFLSLDDNFGPEDPQVGSAFYNTTAMASGDTMTASLWINAVPGILDANQKLFVVADCPFVPGGAGNTWERRERNNAASVAIQTTDPDCYVASVQVPTDAIGGVGPRIYRVRIGRNALGVDTLQVPLTVTIGTPTITYQTLMVDVPRGQEIDVDVSVLTPQAFGGPGQSNQFPVIAAHQLQADSNRSNDAAYNTVSVAAPWWDLAIAVSGPGAAQRCTQTGWTVTVTSVGNVSSPPGVCGFTCICLSNMPGNNNQSLGFNPFNAPALAPGQSWTYQVTNYNVWCNALTQTQYLKAEFDTACSGNSILAPNDSASQPITIY